MSRAGAREKLREKLGQIWELADREWEGSADIKDGIRLYAAKFGGSEHLLTLLMEEAGLSPFLPLAEVFLDEDES
jgi:hypothetical protein